jgi:hypothetical protein
MSTLPKPSVMQRLITAASKEVLNEFVNLYDEHASKFTEEQQADIIKSIIRSYLLLCPDKFNLFLIALIRPFTRLSMDNTLTWHCSLYKFI